MKYKDSAVTYLCNGGHPVFDKVINAQQWKIFQNHTGSTRQHRNNNDYRQRFYAKSQNQPKGNHKHNHKLNLNYVTGK